MVVDSPQFPQALVTRRAHAHYSLVDRPEIVVTISDNEVWQDEFNRWASPLGDNISVAVAENLIAMLATPCVTLYAQNGGVDADHRGSIEVQRFASIPEPRRSSTRSGGYAA
jgi:uncharacterized lipoprotein YmbA